MGDGSGAFGDWPVVADDEDAAGRRLDGEALDGHLRAVQPLGGGLGAVADHECRGQHLVAHDRQLRPRGQLEAVLKLLHGLGEHGVALAAHHADASLRLPLLDEADGGMPRRAPERHGIQVIRPCGPPPSDGERDGRGQQRGEAQGVKVKVKVRGREKGKGMGEARNGEGAAGERGLQVRPPETGLPAHGRLSAAS